MILDSQRMKYKKALKEFVIFSFIGGFGLIVNMALYSFLIYTFLYDKPILANIISTALTILFNWILNRKLTFRSDKNAKTEVIQFFLVSSLALPINAFTLFFIREVLHFESLLTDNLSIVIGTCLGMIIKFVLYKFWVFKVRS